MNIQWIGSPNFTNGRDGHAIQLFVIHWMAGNMASADSTFQNRSRNTSAHFGVEDGNVHQYVDVNNTAYHAGNWPVNQISIGIEHSAQPGRSASDATYESSAQLIAKCIREGKGAKNYKPHNAIVATQCPGDIDINRISNRVNEILGGAGAVTPVVIPPTVVKGIATVTVDAVNVRTKPTSQSPQGGSMVLTKGQTFEYVEAVQGESVRGVSTWLKSIKGNYVWAGGTSYATTPAVASPPAATGGTAQAIRVANVRTQPNTSAPLGGSIQLQPGQTFQYSAKVYGQSVSQNGVTSNLWYHSLKGNYVWAGNCKDV